MTDYYYSCNYQKIANDDDDNHEDGVTKNVNVETPPKRRHSACTWCLYVTMALLGLLMLLSALAGIWGYVWTKRQVIRFTSTHPGDALPIQPMSERELQLVKDRVQLFADTILAHQIPPQDLIITQDELNGFLAHSDFWQGNAFVRIEPENDNDNKDGHENNNEAKLLVDMSLSAQGLPGGKGRYFVAAGFWDIQNQPADDDDKAWVTLHLDTKYPVPDLNHPIWHSETTLYWQKENNDPNGQPKKLVMNIQKGNFLNWVVPPDFIQERRNLMDYILYNDNGDDDDDDCETMRQLIQGIDRISLQEGRVVIHASPFAVVDDNNDDNNNNNKPKNGNHHRALTEDSVRHGRRAAQLLWKVLQ